MDFPWNQCWLIDLHLSYSDKLRFLLSARSSHRVRRLRQWVTSLIFMSLSPSSQVFISVPDPCFWASWIWRRFRNFFVRIRILLSTSKISLKNDVNYVACIRQVKYSNEGDPGPRYNMKEVPGSTRIMLVVHAYPMPLFSEAGDRKPGGWISPLIRATWARSPLAPFKYILHPLQRCRWRPGSVEITLQPLIRGRRP